MATCGTWWHVCKQGYPDCDAAVRTPPRPVLRVTVLSTGLDIQHPVWGNPGQP